MKAVLPPRAARNVRLFPFTPEPCAGSAATKSDLVTEDSAALIFRNRHAGQLLYDHDVGAWFKWSGSHWQLEKTGLAFDWARSLARDLAEYQSPKIKAVLSKTSFVNGVERFCQRDRAFAITSNCWDCDPMLLGTPGGTINLSTGILRDASPGDRITKVTAVAMAEEAECPLWLGFLRDATGGDEALVSFLQQFAGYALTGLTREQVIAFIHGAGGNGKSVFINTIAGVIGDYATTAPMDTFVASFGDRHPTDLAMLRGARLVTASETEEGRSWAESKIKQMTGGDPITARFMRKDFFTFRPQFKLAIIGNHKPVLRNVDEAARRRVLIVPFIHKPTAPDPELETKLRAEWPSILRWMLDGCLDWQADRLRRPEVVTKATDDYFDDQDAVGEWLEEKCIVDPGNSARKTTTAKLFASWTAFAKASNDPVSTMRWFSQVLEKRGLTAMKNIPTGAGTRARGFKGISLRYEQPGSLDADRERPLRGARF